eukprot:5939331-Pleurochrysis_carterae.AAC.1
MHAWPRGGACTTAYSCAVRWRCPSELQRLPSDALACSSVQSVARVVAGDPPAEAIAVQSTTRSSRIRMSSAFAPEGLDPQQLRTAPHPQRWTLVRGHALAERAADFRARADGLFAPVSWASQPSRRSFTCLGCCRGCARSRPSQRWTAALSTLATCTGQASCGDAG